MIERTVGGDAAEVRLEIGAPGIERDAPRVAFQRRVATPQPGERAAAARVGVREIGSERDRAVAAR